MRRLFRILYLLWHYGGNAMMLDPLTNVFNRLMLQELIERELARASRYGELFSLIFIDIDKLKKINDQEGHLAGDRVIQETADFLKAQIRASDSIFRYGGDEFVILLPHTDKNSTEVFVERIRTKMIEEKIHHFSLGYSSWEKSKTIENMVQEADKKMYKDKDKNKDKNKNKTPQ